MNQGTNSELVRQQLRAIRMRKRWSQKFLAGKVQLTKGAIANYENGHRKIEVDAVHILAQALEVSDAELLGLAGSTSRPDLEGSNDLGKSIETAGNPSLDRLDLAEALRSLTEALRQQAEATRLQAQASNHYAEALKLREQNELFKTEKVEVIRAEAEVLAQKNIQKILDASLHPHLSDRTGEEAVGDI